MRIQEGHFLKSASNLDLTLSDDGECPALLISCGIIGLGAFCVELWSFFVSERISVPMSYISLWEHTMLRDWWKNDQIGTKMSPASRSRHPGPPRVPPRGSVAKCPKPSTNVRYTNGIHQEDSNTLDRSERVGGLILLHGARTLSS